MTQYIFRMLKNKFKFCQNLTVPWFTHAFQNLWSCHLTFRLPTCCGVLVIIFEGFLLPSLLFFFFFPIDRETCHFSPEVTFVLVTSVDCLKLTISISASSWHWARKKVTEVEKFLITFLFSCRIFSRKEKSSEIYDRIVS